MLGKALEPEIPISQMQYNANYKETDQEDQCFLEGTVLGKVEKIKYFGKTITNGLKWNTHVSNICTNANRTLGFLRRNLAACPRDVIESAYKGLMQPFLEYRSSVWDPQSILLQDELEKVQKGAARFVTGKYTYETGSLTGILEQPVGIFEKRGGMIVDSEHFIKVSRAQPQVTLFSQNKRIRNQHSLALQSHWLELIFISPVSRPRL